MGAFLVAIVIILLIFKSNNKQINGKVKSAQQASAVMQNSGNKPSMEMMTRIQQLKDAYAKNPGDFQINRELANNYFDLASFDKAIIYYRNALQIQENDPNILIDLGIAYFSSNKADSAIYFVKKALEIQPDHIQGLYNLGIIFYNIQELQKALDAWQELVSRHAESEEARLAKDLIKQVKVQLDKS